MNSRHRFDYALTRGNQSESKICCQNFHVEANGKSVLATEDAKTWEEIEVSLTSANEHHQRCIIVIIIIIIIGWQCKAGRERSTSYQSEDPNPTTPAHRMKAEKRKTAGDRK